MLNVRRVEDFKNSNVKDKFAMRIILFLSSYISSEKEKTALNKIFKNYRWELCDGAQRKQITQSNANARMSQKAVIIQALAHFSLKGSVALK